MATVKQSENPENNPRVRAVFDDIRATRKTDFVNNLWRTLALDPALLESTWAEVKGLMASPTHLDPLTKEMIYIAVSIANSCGYCVHSHTAAARQRNDGGAARGTLGNCVVGRQDESLGHGFTGPARYRLRRQRFVLGSVDVSIVAKLTHRRSG